LRDAQKMQIFVTITSLHAVRNLRQV